MVDLAADLKRLLFFFNGVVGKNSNIGVPPLSFSENQMLFYILVFINYGADRFSPYRIGQADLVALVKSIRIILLPKYGSALI